MNLKWCSAKDMIGQRGPMDLKTWRTGRSACGFSPVSVSHGADEVRSGDGKKVERYDHPSRIDRGARDAAW